MGFPIPIRTGGGQRRYPVHDVDLILAVLKERRRGLSLTAAVDIVTGPERTHTKAGSGAGHPVEDLSLYASLRAAYPHLTPLRAPFRVLLALSWAIEDECLAHASRPVLFGCFQNERAFQVAGHRWRELARNARLAIALSDFEASDPSAAPAVVALPRSSPLLNEWSLICVDPEFSVALVAWEIPRGTVRSEPRAFEGLVSFEPPVVREAAFRLAQVATATSGLAIGDALTRQPDLLREDPRRSASLLSRFASYVGS